MDCKLMTWSLSRAPGAEAGTRTPTERGRRGEARRLPVPRLPPPLRVVVRDARRLAAGAQGAVRPCRPEDDAPLRAPRAGAPALLVTESLLPRHPHRIS